MTTPEKLTVHVPRERRLGTAPVELIASGQEHGCPLQQIPAQDQSFDRLTDSLALATGRLTGLAPWDLAAIWDNARLDQHACASALREAFKGSRIPVEVIEDE